ncbi:MAG: ankyrin repeat domain-containing protein [Proteobacteria bacterium]|nr:ankyrin repeat domain-containing protein [Pseudomonadota bacterium]
MFNTKRTSDLSAIIESFHQRQIKYAKTERIKHGDLIVSVDQNVEHSIGSQRATISPFATINMAMKSTSTWQKWNQGVNEKQVLNDAAACLVFPDESGVFSRVVFAVSDGCGHIPGTQINRYAKRTASGAVKILGRLERTVNLDQSVAKDIATEVERRAFRKGKDKDGKDNGQWNGDGATLLAGSAEFDARTNQYDVKAFNLGDSLSFIYDPSTHRVEMLLDAEERKQGNQYVPDAMATGKESKQLITGVTKKVPQGCVVFTLTDGAWEALPHHSSLVVTSEGQEYRVTKLDENAIARILKAVDERCSEGQYPSVSEYIDTLNQQVFMSHESKRAALIEDRRMIQEFLKENNIDERVKLESLDKYPKMTQDLKTRLDRLKKNSNTTLITVTHLVNTMNNLQLGDDVTILANRLPHRDIELLKAYVVGTMEDKRVLSFSVGKLLSDPDKKQKLIAQVGRELNLNNDELSKHLNYIGLLRVSQHYQTLKNRDVDTSLLTSEQRRLLRATVIAEGFLKSETDLSQYSSLNIQQQIHFIDNVAAEIKYDDSTIENTFREVRNAISRSYIGERKLKLLEIILEQAEGILKTELSTGDKKDIEAMLSQCVNDYMLILHEVFRQKLSSPEYTFPYYRNLLIKQHIKSMQEKILLWDRYIVKENKSIDLSNLNLCEMNFDGIDFRFVDKLDGADVKGCDFSNVLHLGPEILAQTINTSLIIHNFNENYMSKLRSGKYEYYLQLVNEGSEKTKEGVKHLDSFEYLDYFPSDGEMPNIDAIPQGILGYAIYNLLTLSDALYPKDENNFGGSVEASESQKFFDKISGPEGFHGFIHAAPDEQINHLRQFLGFCHYKLSLIEIVNHRTARISKVAEGLDPKQLDPIVEQAKIDLNQEEAADIESKIEFCVKLLGPWGDKKEREKKLKEHDLKYINLSIETYFASLDQEIKQKSKLSALQMTLDYSRDTAVSVDLREYPLEKIDFKSLDIDGVDLILTKEQYEKCLSSEQRMVRVKMLRNAVEVSDLDKVKQIVESGVDMNWQDPVTGHTVFMTACVAGYLPVVAYLLEKGANYESVTQSGKKIIDTAAIAGYRELVTFLLERGDKLSLYGMIAYGDVEHARVEVEAILKDPKKSPSEYIYDNQSLPFFIASYDVPSLLKQLIDSQRVKLDETDQAGNTLLCMASMKGRVENVRILLEYSMDVHVNQGKHNAPLSLCIREAQKAFKDKNETLLNEYLKIIRLLLDKGAKYNHKEALFLYHFNFLTISQVMEKVANKQESQDLLNLACELGNREVVRSVLELPLTLRPLLNMANSYEKSPLSRACEFGHVDIVILLVQAGAKLDSSNDAQYNVNHPLKWAVEKNLLGLAEFLLKKGATPNIPMPDGWLLFIAVKAGNKEMVRLLLEYKASILNTDREGNTALHMAAPKGDPELTTILSHAYAQQIKNKEGKTPLYLAMNAKNRALATFIKTPPTFSSTDIDRPSHAIHEVPNPLQEDLVSAPKLEMASKFVG